MNRPNHSYALEKHLNWFQSILDFRMKAYFENSEFLDHIASLTPPELEAGSPLDDIFLELDFGWEERVIIILALVPHVRPQTLDVFLINNPTLNKGFTEFGGVKGKIHSGFLPTKETAAFILAGQNLQERVRVMKILHPSHALFRNQILETSSAEVGEPLLSMPLHLTKTFLPKVLWNENYTPEFGSNFPAQKVSTRLNWEDLVLPNFVMDEVLEIKSWMKHQSLIQENWGLKKLIKPGYRTLFYGPPGTGKTLTALLIGKELSQDIYKIDLSMVVSKYIGETEKNLAKVFDMAVHNDWILFFDEADALFGKRTVTQSSNDRYANQEVSYLLQRIESFPGLVILASNFKGNLDEAFIRRFQSMIHFPAPSSAQRLKLWSKAFPEKLPLSKNVDLESLSEKYEITGGEIINVLRYAAIKAAENGHQEVEQQDILDGINKEFQKKGGALDL